MKEDNGTIGNDSFVNDAVEQLRGLGKMQMAAFAQKRAGDDQNVSPKKEENPPQSKRDQLIARMVAERQAKNGMCTYAEKQALAHYVDSKVATLGEGATVDDLSPSEQDMMVGHARNVDEDMLYLKEGGDRITVGPVQRACQTVPLITTPDYPPEPQPPVDPMPGVKATMWNEPMPPDKPGVWFKDDDERAKAEQKYEEDMKKYEEDHKKWEDKKNYDEDMKKYEEDHKKWLEDTKKADAKADGIEKALALGLMKVDYDPETGKYTYAQFNSKGVWETAVVDDPEEVKRRATRAIEARAINRQAMAIPVTDDMLAKIATGDLKVAPNSQYGLTVTEALDNGQMAPPKIIMSNDPDAVKALCDSTAGYQKQHNLKYDDMDGKAYDNVEEKKALLDKCTTDENGNRICSVCGKPWPAPAAPASPEAPSATDAQVPQTGPSSPIQESSPTGGVGSEGAVGVPMLRGQDMLVRKIRYRAGYAAWEKIDASVSLTKASLSALGEKSLTGDQLDRLARYIRSIIGNNAELANRFCRSLSAACASSSAVSGANVNAVLRSFNGFDSHEILEIRGLIKCPLCGQEITREDRPMNTEMTKAETVFKGDERTDEDARKEFNGRPYTKAEGSAELLRDGTQQAFNPFIDPNGTWTKFSYRPTDSKEGYPIIRIVPASFQGMANIDKVLNTAPYVLIKEYFMRNNVSSAVNLFQGALEGKADAPSSAEANEPGKIKSYTENLTETIKNAFIDLGKPITQVIDMPFVLYHRLKAKLYGNQYVFPYNPKDFALAQSSNTEEWGGEGILSSLAGGLMNATNGLTGMLGFGIAKPFPAPTWKLPDGGTKWSMSFDLNLINDEFVRARNNYMCSNTIINNNRWIQKTILGFPGALYEVLIPTGLRELMCTGTFTLKPLGVNRHVPHDFFDVPFKIGSTVYGSRNGDMHSSAYEVVPDAYALNCSFQSAIAENLNNSVFAYYLKITDFAPGTPTDSAFEAMDSTAPWASMAVAEEKVDDVAMVQKTVSQIKDQVRQLVGDQGDKAAADDAKKQADAARVSDPPADGGGGTPAAGAVPPAASKRDTLMYDEQMDVYERKYKVFVQKLYVVKSDIDANRKLFNSLMERSENLPMTKIRKTYSMRISKVNDEYSELKEKEREIEDSLTELEMSVLMHAKDAVEERTHSSILAVPRGYFDPYKPDEITALKIKLMTRDELDKFIAEKEAHLNAIDEWGIHNCKDFWIRVGAINFISDAMGELEDLMRDAYEVDTDAHDKYRYRYEMLRGDLDAALDPSKPFILNRTNIIYIPPENLPQNILFTIGDESAHSSVDASNNGGEGSSQELIETGGDGQVPAVVQMDDGSLVADRDELIKQHRAEVIKQMFKDEDGLAAAAFRTAIERYPAAKFDRDALVVLKKMPQLDDEADMTGWFGSQEGEMYANVHERMEEREDGSVAIFPIDQTFDIHSVSRSSCIFYLTQDLYRYVSMCRTVLLGNAMDMVNTKSTAVLNRVTQQFQRLEN